MSGRRHPHRARSPWRPVLALLTALFAAGPVEAAGPWRGQVVDAETNQPLAGVVVLAIWDKISPSLIHPQRDFHDVDELVTDAEGRFVVPARSRWFLNPLVHLDGPRLEMFKGGYGRYVNRRSYGGGNIDDMRNEMEKRGVVFEIPPLKTREERRRALPVRPGVPDHRMPKFMEALNAERVFHGLEPL
jgi:hypothetical protein